MTEDNHDSTASSVKKGLSWTIRFIIVFAIIAGVFVYYFQGSGQQDVTKTKLKEYFSSDVEQFQNIKGTISSWLDFQLRVSFDAEEVTLKDELTFILRTGVDCCRPCTFIANELKHYLEEYCSSESAKKISCWTKKVTTEEETKNEVRTLCHLEDPDRYFFEHTSFAI